MSLSTINISHQMPNNESHQNKRELKIRRLSNDNMVYGPAALTSLKKWKKNKMKNQCQLFIFGRVKRSEKMCFMFITMGSTVWQPLVAAKLNHYPQPGPM